MRRIKQIRKKVDKVKRTITGWPRKRYISDLFKKGKEYYGLKKTCYLGIEPSVQVGRLPLLQLHRGTLLSAQGGPAKGTVL
jgi:hypothetical protein